MAIKYKELIQDDEVGDELIKDTKNSKKDFDSLQCKCELLEDEDENDEYEDEDEYVEFTWSEIGKSMLTFKIELNIHYFREKACVFLRDPDCVRIIPSLLLLPRLIGLELGQWRSGHAGAAKPPGEARGIPDVPQP